mgnify:CR=1 FL=1
MKLAVASVIILSLAGCATKTETVFVQDPLPLPDRPQLPLMPSDEMQCLSDEAYEGLAVRDAMLRKHVERLEDVIRTTH